MVYIAIPSYSLLYSYEAFITFIHRHKFYIHYKNFNEILHLSNCISDEFVVVFIIATLGIFIQSFIHSF